jgi:hypothetical protein
MGGQLAKGDEDSVLVRNLTPPNMDTLIEQSAELCDAIRMLWTLKQLEANTRVRITEAYQTLGEMLDALPPITEKTTEQRRKELQNRE